jgi:nitrite reductase/ring-hydroxylating ferredoxin subunit
MLNSCPDEQSDRTTTTPIHRFFRHKRCSFGKDDSDGKLYALCDRCSHMNAPLSMGTLNGKVVTCPMHGARFDVTTGKKVGEPMALDPSKLPEPLPESLQKMFAHSAEIQSKIKTYDQPTYETRVDGNRVKVRM